MRVVKKEEFGAVTSYELGYSLIGPPMMATRCYILGNTFVDTGQAHMEKAVLEIAEKHQIQRIFLTHHHEDHSGNAAALQRRFQVPVYGHEETRRKMAQKSKIFPYQILVWGHSTPLDIEPFEPEIQTQMGPLIPYHTPGHSKDHMAYLLKDHGILFSGDIYLADRIKYFRADENIGSQIESLKKIEQLDFDVLLCGHYPRKENGRTHILTKLGFLEDFYGSVVEHRQQGLSAKQIFKALCLTEATFIKYFCFGNVSMMNGVKSVIRHYEP